MTSALRMAALVVLAAAPACVRLVPERPADGTVRPTDGPKRSDVPSLPDLEQIVDRGRELDGRPGADVGPPAAALPKGVIVMWSGALADIPEGWALCDGNGGTPDLRGRFLLGAAAQEEPGATGGSSSHAHTMGAHTHQVDPPPTATSVLSSTLTVTNDTVHSPKECTGAHTHTVNIPAVTSSSAQPAIGAATLLPPYYKLAFIIKL